MNNTMKQNHAIVALLLLIIMAELGQLDAAPHRLGDTITLKEHLGYAWNTDYVHRELAATNPGSFFADRVLLYEGQRLVTSQLDAVTTYADGSLKSGVIWFRTDLPARSQRIFTLRGAEAVPPEAKQTDLTITATNGVLEVANALTAVRLPATPAAPAEARSDGTVAGPVLGVRLPSGQWTAPMLFKPAKGFQGFKTQVTARGPLFIRVHVAGIFAGKEQYAATFTIRSQDPLIRVDERFSGAGSWTWDLYPGLQPSQLIDHVREGDFQKIPLTYDARTALPAFVGWDFYLRDHSAVMAFAGGPSDDLLGLLTTDSDWFPFPYASKWEITAEPGPRLQAKASVETGQRHFGLLIGKGATFANNPADVYRWFQTHVAMPLDKVAGSILEWPGMEDVEFPHTFFTKKDIPEIRQRLQANADISREMTNLVGGADNRSQWNAIRNLVTNGGSASQRERATAYINRFETQGGLALGASEQAGMYLFSGNDIYLRQLKEDMPLPDREGPLGLIKAMTQASFAGLGLATGHRFGHMEYCDRLFRSLAGLELVLGTDLTQEERREYLTHIAFINYLLRDTLWLPFNLPNLAREGEDSGYAQGTENQKQGVWAVRGMTAAMLPNHPLQRAWIEQALDDNARNIVSQVNPEGVFYEGPGYAHRVMSRIQPFWLAMERTGVTGQERWMVQAKNSFQFLADLLTPPDPRFGGFRGYTSFGRSEPGYRDFTLLDGVFPWGATDPSHGQRMRWAWESVGKPPFNSQGGRDLSFHLLAASNPFTAPTTCPLSSRYWDGFGSIFRSAVRRSYESSVMHRFGRFCWGMGSEGAVYFWGKGAPLAPRFGTWWMNIQMRRPEFSNTLLFEQPTEKEMAASGMASLAQVRQFASKVVAATLANVADYSVSQTTSKDWRRAVLFAKDINREDPVYLLVRDDVSRNAPTALHWWLMTKDVLPQGQNGKAVVDYNIPGKDVDDREAIWVANIGKHWKDAPKLTGPLHHFSGAWGVDVDLFMLRPENPRIVVDAVGAGPGIPYCPDPKYQDCQQLIRIEQPARQGYTTLLVPRWPNESAPEYRRVAEGAGVALKWSSGEDRLFLSDDLVTYKDDVVEIRAHGGFVRHGSTVPLRLMVVNGSISADGVTITCPSQAALLFDGAAIHLTCATASEDVQVTLPERLQQFKMTVESQSPATKKP